ncbi:hypothetical protein CHELA1G11_14527 [Hyphomicrobiales bacterium]|nr:hypothetical protein CHELA1G11_14527 [Hyphomicrobiales bacterium]
MQATKSPPTEPLAGFLLRRNRKSGRAGGLALRCEMPAPIVSGHHGPEAMGVGAGLRDRGIEAAETCISTGATAVTGVGVKENAARAGRGPIHGDHSISASGAVKSTFIRIITI